MLVPYSLLKYYVDVDVTPQELEDKLFDAGFEVEERYQIGKDISSVVVGEVVECEAIPDTHLHVCKVNVGGPELLQICCGADNVQAGGKYPAALPGATVLATGKDHKTVEGVATIKKGKMRGYESNGMLCSGTELGLTEDLYPGSDYFGLLVLPEDAVPGEDVKKLTGLDEEIFDISLTANRSDCQSIFGIAREVAAILKKPVKMPALDYTQSDYIFEGLNITVEAPDLCPRYLGHGVRNITPGESPAWMKRYLALCGLRSISNVVDITNFVMLELGQPMHAFDMETLESNQIIVRRAARGETIQTLDEKEFTLNPENLVICDGSKPVALAGIMGGLNSEITPETTQLLFESAKFARDNVRKTSKSLGQRTDAASHYEKGVSEYTVEMGMARALHLIQELGCGEITASAFDCDAGEPKEGKQFTAAFSGINRILGIEVPRQDVLDILKSLYFEVKAEGDVMEVTAPRYREDIEVGEPDLAEEVIREYGYDHIKPTFLQEATVTTGGLNPQQKTRSHLKKTLCAQGFYEVSTFAFYSPADLDALHLPEDALERQVIRLINPITEKLSIMRRTLAPSMLNVVVENLKKGNAAGRIFEISNVYIPVGDYTKNLPEEVLHLGFAGFGEEEDFFTMKGAVEELAEVFGLSIEYERCTDVSYLHPGIAAYILADGERIGQFGKLANAVTAELPLPRDGKENYKIFLGEIDFAGMCAHMPERFRYKPISEFGNVDRDLAVVVSEETECGAVVNEIMKGCDKVSKVDLFDIYRSEQIGAGKKSMAFKITFTPEEKAITPEDITRFMKKIVGNLKFRLGAEQR
ncbi:MAG: phenylalanine--tRNA ligase subunit beta [Lachnospiraceae bacterium]|nr:phenylalanine--tRNA ligase subunit beta [Lachnospiraceae bacterium]